MREENAYAPLFSVIDRSICGYPCTSAFCFEEDDQKKTTIYSCVQSLGMGDMEIEVLLMCVCRISFANFHLNDSSLDANYSRLLWRTQNPVMVLNLSARFCCLLFGLWIALITARGWRKGTSIPDHVQLINKRIVCRRRRIPPKGCFSLFRQLFFQLSVQS